MRDRNLLVIRFATLHQYETFKGRAEKLSLALTDGSPSGLFSSVPVQRSFVFNVSLYLNKSHGAGFAPDLEKLLFPGSCSPGNHSTT